MITKASKGEFDVIVVGSGMGGMTTAAALSRMGRKVLLLEQAQTIGGLTHAFSRDVYQYSFGHVEPGRFRIFSHTSGFSPY